MSMIGVILLFGASGDVGRGAIASRSSPRARRLAPVASRPSPRARRAPPFDSSMLHITRLVLREIRLPLREPFRISSGVCTERRILLLELHDASGTVGWSECVAGELPNYSPETIDTAWHALREWLAPRVVGHFLRAADGVHALLGRGVRGHAMAKAALEMGCWDVEARLRGVPLARLLGGTQPRVPVGISLGIQADPDALVARARAADAQGYRKIKVKIQPGADIEYLRAVREALGRDVALMADA